MKKPILFMIGGVFVISTLAIEPKSGTAAGLRNEKNVVSEAKALAKNYKHKSDITGIQPMEVDTESLKALGIRIANGNVYQSLAHGGYVCYTKQGTSFPEMSKANRHTTVYPRPVLVTDDLGNWRSYKCQEIGLKDELLENSVCIDETRLAGQLKKMIPVLVRSGQEFTFIDKVMGNWRPDVIFWYEDTAQMRELLRES